MNAFEKSKWIWPISEPQADEYAEFYEEVSFFGKIAELHLNDNGFFDKKIERAGTIGRAYRDRFSVKSMYLPFGNILDDALSSYI